MTECTIQLDGLAWVGEGPKCDEELWPLSLTDLGRVMRWRAIDELNSMASRVMAKQWKQMQEPPTERKP